MDSFRRHQSFSTFARALAWTACGWIWLMVCWIQPAICAQTPPGSSQSGKFQVFVKGKPVGMETFQITGDEYIGEVSIDLGVKVNGKSRLRYRGNQIEFFEAEQNNARLALDTSTTPMKLTSPAGTREVTIPDGAILLETVYLHQYHALVNRYDLEKGGKQSFQTFVPTIGMVFPLTCELIERIDPAPPNQPITLLKFQTNVANVQVINLITDENRSILMIDVPAQGYTVVREGFESLRPRPEAEIISDKYDRVEVEIPATGGVKLAGTLTIPKNGSQRHPVVVLITGSGPQDRDEDTPPFINYHLFRLIADRLSQNGIATLRCDDRGVGKSTGDFLSAGFHDFIADARVQVEFLRKRPEIDSARISVLGHSEGGYIAPLLAATDPRLKSVVILAGPSKRLDPLMIEQLEYQAGFQDLPEGTRSYARSLIDATKKMIADVKANKPVVDKEGRKLVKVGRLQWNITYFRQHFAHDPIGTIRKVRCPVLILQGDRDVLVQKYHAEALTAELKKAGNKNVALHIFPYLTHMFTTFPYNNPDPKALSKSETVSDEFLEALKDWGIKNF